MTHTIAKYQTWVFLLLLVMFSGCAWTGPIVQADDPQADEPFAAVKAQVIEAQALVLATYRTIPPNVESGIWTREFGAKVYDAASELEAAIVLVRAAINLGNLESAEARAMTMMSLLGALKSLTQGDMTHGNQDHTGASGKAV